MVERAGARERRVSGGLEGSYGRERRVSGGLEGGRERKVSGRSVVRVASSNSINMRYVLFNISVAVSQRSW